MIQTKFKERYYLQLIRSIDSTIDIISQVLLIISNKRMTLAEKAIMHELCGCIYWNSRLIAILAQLIMQKKYILTAIDGKMLRQTNNRLIGQLQDFYKAANHSLNYLEQYFEHDFWLALNQDQVLMRLSRIVAHLSSVEQSTYL